MAESEVWAEKVERPNGKAQSVLMTNGAVGIPFVEKNGKIIELPHSRLRLDGATICGAESLWMPRAHYLKAREMAAAILREKALRSPKKNFSGPLCISRELDYKIKYRPP